MKNKINLVLLVSPIGLNFVINLFTEFKFSETNFTTIALKLLTTSILFLVLLFIGKAIENTINLNSVTVSIIIYLTTFYILNYYFMFFLKDVSTKNIFITYNVLIFIVLVRKSRLNLKYLALAISLMLLLNIFYNLFNIYDLILFSNPITTDEVNMWILRSEVISDTNMYQIYDQRVGGGTMSFGLLVHFSFVLLEYILHFSSGYFISQIIPNVIFLLFIYFVYENYQFNFHTKAALITILLLFLTSDWFAYFMVNSYLGETFSTFYFGVLFYYLIKNKLSLSKYALILFYLSNLIYAKRFILILVLLSLVHLLFLNKDKFLIHFLIPVIPLFPIILNHMTLEVPILWIVENEPTNAILYEGPSYNLSAIISIFNQFFIDKPVSYFVFCILFLIFINRKILISHEKTLISLLVINTMFVFLYFVFISTLNNSWGDSFRYLLNTSYIMFFLFIDLFNKKKEII